MSFEIYVNIDKHYSNNNIEEVILYFNKIITKYNDYKIPFTIVITNISITIKTYDNTIILKNLNGLNITQNDIYLLPLFILNNKYIKQISVDKLREIIELNPNSILDILMCKEVMIDPYYLLVNLFNVNEELIYQTFILYLNKTISIANEANKININNIINDFFNDRKNVININKYHKLFSFYMSNKKILPFMIEYNPYKSNLL
ncbi:hypothetical protein QKU48_gp0178 [Fadolivirus algeromassiliense]|jgi:hypothetical protein|uniref:Uncharacterized protein n=1 Tax=Fadolivirus FV1/VV64 TaxID=3070911 RepID=A0A7D3V7B1_9VIRU|nr:hypothetical protein QKU48_gp0178 [Fadolivirus algeromassiliense]QKF93636.1 hypothetical protein Fadolivirus_1_178 [Fadolivirus FV1/VV64]